MKLTGLFRKLDGLIEFKHGETIPFGVPPLDLITGGGLPSGAIVELFGKESSGKSTVALHHCAEIISRGGVVVYADGEYSLDERRATALGITDFERFIVKHPDSVESLIDLILGTAAELRKAVGPDLPILYVIDSIAAFPAASEYKGSAQLGQQAKAFNSGFRRAMSVIAKARAGVVAINQSRVKFNVMFGDATTTTGGDALKFYASLRVQVKQIRKVKGKEIRGLGYNVPADDVVGTASEFTTVKNKLVDPFRKAHGILFFRSGYDNNLSLFESLRQYDLVAKGSSRTAACVKGVPGEFSKNEFSQFFEDNREQIQAVLADSVFGRTYAEGDADLDVDAIDDTVDDT